MGSNDRGDIDSKKVAVLLGGMSAEKEVSMETGNAVFEALEDLGYDAVKVIAGPDLPAVLDRVKPDLAFIALHGRGGEDGTVQGLLEIMRIPYTGCGVLASAMTMDKDIAKQVMEKNGIPVVKGLVARAGAWKSDFDNEVKINIGYPVIVKPACEGSSIAITIVEDQSGLPGALDTVFEIDSRAIVEKFIDGRLLTVGIVGEGPRVLPVLEVKTRKSFYDYQAKYEPGFTEYEVPAAIENGIADKAQKLSLASFQALECEGMARIDLMLENDTGQLYVLEVNTIPGMTSASLLPKAAAADGISFNDLVEIILRGARTKTHLVW